MTTTKNKARGFLRITLVALALLILTCGVFGCGPSELTQQKEVHVAVSGSDETGEGTSDAPYASISAAAEAWPGSIIVVHEGDYGPIILGSRASGLEGSPTTIRPAEGESVVIHAGDGIGVSIVNTTHISIEGLEVEGGTHGIYYESTREAEQALTGIRIAGCTIHGVRGTHGICVYARNDLMPVQDLTIEDCEVYDCECGSSESVVLNGNVNGFVIEDNYIHDNNNIGIDMIGFEGTAKHPDEYDGANPYEFDMVRNGICTGNVICNISTEGNPAYLEDGEYDLCADGIYVDGGQNIEICNNFVFNCDIGLEVGTEHSPNDNDLFRVSGVHVHDNIIADCTGWAGICFGGYEPDLGFTEDCIFERNTLLDNGVQIGVQRSRDNSITGNLIVGGKTAIEYNDDLDEGDMVNDISRNVFCEIEDEDSWSDEYGTMSDNRDEVLDGFRSLVDGVGSSFVPDGEFLELYSAQMAASEI